MDDMVLGDSGHKVLVLETTDKEATVAVSAEGRWELRTMTAEEFNANVKPRPTLSEVFLRATVDGAATPSPAHNLKLTFEGSRLTKAEVVAEGSKT